MQKTRVKTYIITGISELFDQPAKIMGELKNPELQKLLLIVSNFSIDKSSKWLKMIGSDSCDMSSKFYP